ncbi:IS110 family transposase [Nocardioides immobilis]|uniref:IS110 family transposase n=1 Tax=Nocardioides immobilis TaxID=2049295 RepID=A0A417XUE3_9ACTN|nr:IS110 family transposase [Nocardioides immobilis]RHW24124.1 IS110 family transposase [Nocardioides immobilis]
MSVEHEAIQEKRTQLTAGIDWASADHAVAIVDAAGVQQDRFVIPHTGTGLRQLVRRLRRARVWGVAIERPDGPVVDALLEAELTVFVIAPNQLKNLRSRYGSAGNKDNSFDAYVLADTLRTDRPRLRPLTRDSEATMTLRMTVRARQDLVAARVAMANQLRAHLQTTLPGAIGLFRDIDSAITLAFLTRFPSQDKTDWLSRTRLRNWLRSVGYNRQANLDRLWTPLNNAPAGTRGPEAAARAHVTLAMVAALTSLRAQIKALEAQIAVQLAQHPDAAVFTSLPRSGTVRAARLLAEIGDARGRYPTPEALICLAGAAPSTKQSGKVKVVTFRWAVDKQLRGAVVDFAGDSHHDNPWAADLYQRARARNHDHPHAVRILARDWHHVIWRCWQDGVPYDPAKHHALQRVLASTA